MQCSLIWLNKVAVGVQRPEHFLFLAGDHAPFYYFNILCGYYNIFKSRMNDVAKYKPVMSNFFHIFIC